ncbi:MAG: metal-dependent hydrolase [Crocinitomicaceae bacterium]|nr:metal-dependent hydrolase [Crocinitomicaceae bacterium]|tara:strand:+ start:1446 stop:2192 length:747 start_codon:yes stop_codon:yes gene_type:complete
MLWDGSSFEIDLGAPLDISLALKDSRGQKTPSAWYVEGPKFDAVRSDGFIGRVAEGGAVNFTDVYFNPHGHGTHTECLGHITTALESIDSQIRNLKMPPLVACAVVSVEPSFVDGDRVILPKDLPSKTLLPPAMVIRTLPNNGDKKTKAWDNTNPPYLDPEFTRGLVERGVEHLLVDLPSVDKEVDGGLLKSHRVFFGVPDSPRFSATITEFIYVPDYIVDGLYAINLQIAPFDLDASPSRPVLFPLK